MSTLMVDKMGDMIDLTEDNSDEDDDDSSLSSHHSEILQEPFQIEVKGAKTYEVNGVFNKDGYYEGCPMYSKQGKWKKKNCTFSIFQCQIIDDGKKYWYISIVPPGLEPGTTKDLDFYYAPVGTATTYRHIPPVKGWIHESHGRLPAPTLSYHFDVNDDNHDNDDEANNNNNNNENIPPVTKKCTTSTTKSSGGATCQRSKTDDPDVLCQVEITKKLRQMELNWRPKPSGGVAPEKVSLTSIQRDANKAAWKTTVMFVKPKDRRQLMIWYPEVGQDDNKLVHDKKITARFIERFHPDQIELENNEWIVIALEAVDDTAGVENTAAASDDNDDNMAAATTADDNDDDAAVNDAVDDDTVEDDAVDDNNAKGPAAATAASSSDDDDVGMTTADDDDDGDDDTVDDDDGVDDVTVAATDMYINQSRNTKKGRGVLKTRQQQQQQRSVEFANNNNNDDNEENYDLTDAEQEHKCPPDNNSCDDHHDAVLLLKQKNQLMEQENVKLSRHFASLQATSKRQQEDLDNLQEQHDKLQFEFKTTVSASTQDDRKQQRQQEQLER